MNEAEATTKSPEFVNFSSGNFSSIMLQESLPDFTSERQTNNLESSQRISQHSHTSMLIRLPVLEFVREICHSLKSASDQALRPKPTIGFNQQYSRELDLTELLESLEKGEKKLALISEAAPGLNQIGNISRAVALNCGGIIRSLRKELICGKSDPAHPEQEQIGNTISMLDACYFKLHAERINLEDLVIKIVLQQQFPDQYQDVA